MNAPNRFPEILIPEPVWKRLMAYMLSCPEEVGGLGAIAVRDGALVVEDVFLLEQEVTRATTRLDPSAVARLVARFAAEGRDPGSIRFWWHSHAAMDVFWSAVDLETIRELSEDGWLLAMVGNHRGETRVCLSVRNPLPIFLDDLPFRIAPDIDPAVVAAVRAEIRAKVTRAPSGIFRRRGPIEPAAPDAEPAVPSGRYARPERGGVTIPAELRFPDEEET